MCVIGVRCVASSLVTVVTAAFNEAKDHAARRNKSPLSCDFFAETSAVKTYHQACDYGKQLRPYHTICEPQQA